MGNMNWSLLYITYKILSISWAAPIDLLTSDEIKAFDPSAEANNVTEKLNNLVNNPDNYSNTSSFSEPFNANFYKVPEDSIIFTLDPQKNSQNITDVVSNSKGIFGKEPWPFTLENTTESIIEHLEITQDSSNSHNGHGLESIVHSTKAPQQTLLTSEAEVDQTVADVTAVPESFSNNYAISLNKEETAKHHNNYSAIEYHMLMQPNKTIFPSKSDITHQELNLNTSAEENTKQHFETILEQTTQTLNLETVSSNSRNTLAYFNQNINETTVPSDLINDRTSEPSHAFKQSVDSPIQDAVERRNQLDFLPTESAIPSTNKIFLETIYSTVNPFYKTSKLNKNSQNPSSHQDFEATTNYETSLRNLISTKGINEIEEIPKSFKNRYEDMANRVANMNANLTLQSSKNKKADESSGVTPVLQETVADAFSSQVAAIGYNIQEVGMERNYSLINPVTKNSQTEGYTYLQSNETPHQDPNYKHALDSFIKNITYDIEENTTNEPVPTNTQIYDVGEGSITPILTVEQPLNSLIEKSDVPVENLKANRTDIYFQDMRDKEEGTVTTTLYPVEILKGSYANNVIILSSDSTNISEPFAQLIEPTSAKVGETSFELISTSEKRPEAATDDAIGSHLEQINFEGETNSESQNYSLEVSSGQALVGNFYEGQQNIKDSVNSKTQHKSNQTVEIDVKGFDVNNEIKRIKVKEVKVLERQDLPKYTNKQNTEYDGPKQNIVSLESPHYNQVIEATSPESETENTSTTIQPEIATPFETLQFDEVKNSATEVLMPTTTVVQASFTERTAGKHDERKRSRSILENEISEINENVMENSSTTYTATSYPKMQETTTTEYSLLEETTISTEANQQKTLASALSLPASSLYTEESTTLSLEEATTILPEIFAEEPKGTTEALKETTLQEPGNEIDINKLDETDVVKRNFNDQTTTSMQPEVAANSSSSTSKEVYRDGEIQRNFVDRLDNYYDESLKDILNISATESTNKMPELQEIEIHSVQTTMTPFDLSTMQKTLEVVKRDHVQLIKDRTQYDVYGHIIATTNENTSSEKEESTSEAEPARTEYISKTTPAPTLVGKLLGKEINRDSFKTTITNVTEEVSTPEHTTQSLEIKQEFFTTIHPFESVEVTTSLPFLKKTVTFIQHVDSTTNSQPLENDAQEPLDSTQTHVTLMQTPFMKEEQQQIESTTTIKDAQIEQTAATTSYAESTEQTTRETEIEINSTTLVEENQATIAPEQSQARPLSLPPPKLEYLQSDDGVEVFYGYSMVKRN